MSTDLCHKEDSCPESNHWQQNSSDSDPEYPYGDKFDMDPVQHDFITVEELATLLRVDRKTVYHMLQTTEVPGVHRIGKTIRICRSSMLKFLAEGNSALKKRRR